MQRRYVLVVNSPLAEPIAREMGDAKLLNVLDERLLEDDLSDDEADWNAAAG